MSALSLFKSATELLVSVGAGAIVGNAIKATTPSTAGKIPSLRLLNHATITIGGFVITGMIGEAASKYASEQIDKAAEQFTHIKSSMDDLRSDADDAIGQTKENVKAAADDLKAGAKKAKSEF